MSRFLPIVLVVSAAAGSYVAASLAADYVEGVTEDEMARVLAEGGFDWASSRVDGLAVELTGEAPDEATRFAALTAAGQIVDAGRIANEMTVSDVPDLAPPPFVIEILQNDDGISIIGLVPAATNIEQIVASAEGAAEGAPVSELLETADHPEPEGWVEAVEFALNQLGDLPRAKVTVTPENVTISAVTTAPNEKRELEQSLSANKPEALDLTLDISAPRPVISPFTLRYVLNEGVGRFDACSADTEASREKILSAARLAGLSGNAECRLGLGVPSRLWGDAAAAAIKALNDVGGGTLTISNADVSLISKEGAPEDAFDLAIGTLDQALPGVFTLTAIRPEVPEEDPNADAPPEFVATLSPEGALQMRGRLPSEQVQEVVRSFAAAAFGSRNLTPATRVVDDLPAGWSTRVLVALEALSVLENGAIIVSPDTISVSGVTGRQDASDEIARLMSDGLADGAEFEIDVSYSEALDPLAALPTPEECVASINSALEANKITFAPSSSDIDPSAREVIDQIADILRDCGEVPMEVAGHTDSQGRETMNQSLSQARADAVLNAILARRVLVSNLTAKGYGEANPIADNDTAEGREANRRIEFTLLTPETSEDVEATEESEGTE